MSSDDDEETGGSYLSDETGDEKEDLTAADNILWDAIEQGDARGVQQAIRNGADVNCVTVFGTSTSNFTDTSTPLNTACESGNDRIVRILLDAGASARWYIPGDYNVRDVSSAIVKACSEKHLSIVELLLQHDKTLLELVDGEGRTPLHLAVRKGHGEIVQFLMDRGANVHATDQYGKTVFMYACESFKLDTVQLLLSAGVDLEARDNDQRTALYHAVVEGDVNSLRFLMDRGANVHATDRRGATPLMVACECGHLEILRILLAVGVDLHARDATLYTALHFATHSVRMDLLQELILVHNANMIAVDESGHTPFDLVSHLKFADPLLEMYGWKMTRDHGRLALHELLSDAEYSFPENKSFHPRGHVLICLLVGELTLDHWRTLFHTLDNELIRNRDDAGKLPIHIACQTNAPAEVLAMLVELDSATLQIADHSGALPLHECCRGSVNCFSVRYVVEQGGVGTLAARNHQGAMPLHILCGSTNPPLTTVQYLVQSFPGSLQAQTNAGLYPFMIAAEKGSTSLGIVYDLVRASPNLVIPK